MGERVCSSLGCWGVLVRLRPLDERSDLYCAKCHAIYERRVEEAVLELGEAPNACPRGECCG